MKRFDLMDQVNVCGTFMVSKFAVPYLEKSANTHILMLSPPLDFRKKLPQEVADRSPWRMENYPVRARGKT